MLRHDDATKSVDLIGFYEGIRVVRALEPICPYCSTRRSEDPKVFHTCAEIRQVVPHNNRQPRARVCSRLS